MRCLFLFIVCLFSQSMWAQRNIFDGFDDNSNGWPEAAGPAGTMTVQKGMYHIAGNSEGYWQHTHTVTGGFSDHFRIEASVARDSGVSLDKGVGLVWGVKGDSARMTFLIYGDGHFAYQHARDGKSQTFAPKDVTFAIDAEGFNNLRVERNMGTAMYDFFINEQLVLSAPFVAPASDQVGLYSDMAGSFHFDNFWFIERADSAGSHRPQPLMMSDACTDNFYYHSENGYSFCVPFGWRVDEYKETHATIWPVGMPYVITSDYTRLAIEDSFGVAAKNDFKIFVDSMRSVQDMQAEPLSRVATDKPGVEVWGATIRYTQMEGWGAVYHARYYIYNRASGGFLLLECKIPVWEEELSLHYLGIIQWMAGSVAFE